ncbi:MAG: orotidine 5'-phosphate decarboxylase [Candidatus Diapherotrites archaeon]|uniref:Orotidine 5'-phosphate decarboxylase n=1 Tax=Candidatus Iainarchaeum sp. TaxID=3101447 RepID=A0A8T3YJA0_9ARCH|nr:orotidine 5'-phosphate decarboxylase [Candidatus Diapherotrites archaeon]
MAAIIRMKRSIVPACDFDDIKALEKLVKGTDSVKGIGAYKIGFELGLKYGLPAVVKACRKHTKKPLIYDHQKAGTDVPFTGGRFAAVCRGAGIDAVILFPQAGPATEREWIKACMNAGLGVIVGGEMTHEAYLKADGGFLDDDAPLRMYGIAAESGVNEFVVPGNKPDRIAKYRKFLEAKGMKPVFHSPGLVSQGGSITESGKAAGEHWHAIVGRALYEAADIRKAAQELCSQISGPR